MKKNPEVIKRTVLEMGGKITEVIPERGCFYVEIKDKKFLITRKIAISKNLITSGKVAKYKDLTYKLLKEKGLPTPKTIGVYKKTFNRDSLLISLDKLKKPLIIKDAEGSQSNGIYPFIKTSVEAIDLIEKLLHKHPRLVVQEMVFGAEYRLLVLDNKLIGALKMIPPRVFGDGKKTIKELIHAKQRELEKKTPFDKDLDEILEKQGYSLDHILGENKFAFIKKSSALAEGGETEDVTDTINPSIIEIAAQAADALNKYLVGIDIICEDIAKSPDTQELNILEINAKPDLYVHYYPTIGTSRDVVREIVEFMIKLEK